MGKRQYTQKEWKLLSWWLAQYHPHASIAMNVRLGPTMRIAQVGPVGEVAPGVLRLRNRWADAVFVENNQVNLVEAKLEPDPGIFSTLVHYARALRADPSYAQWRNLPLRLIALVYHDDPTLASEAPFYGVQWIVYQPKLDELPRPMVRGVALETIAPELPQDWPARLNAWGIIA
jgi:hypothetical protein